MSDLRGGIRLICGFCVLLTPVLVAGDDLQGIRVTGTIRAVRQHLVQVPRIQGQSGRVTLTWIIPNSATVETGDIVAEFDPTQQQENAREALAKYEDLLHTIDQKKAENRVNAQQRAEEMEQAKADLAKARLQLGIAPVLSEIERLKNQVRLEDAQARVASLEISHRQHEIANQASHRLLEIQAARQKTALDRARDNIERLVIRASHGGMVAHEYVFRGNTRGPPQIGDQIYRGNSLLRIFDPREMEVIARVGEPDGEVLEPGARAVVILDAYPDLRFPARLKGASPVAASALASPIKKFQALFTLEQNDPHILPDLSAAVIILPEGTGPTEAPQ